MDNLFSKIISTIRRSFIGPLICWRFYVVSAKEAIVMVSIDMGVSFLHRRLSGPLLGVDDMEPASNHFLQAGSPRDVHGLELVETSEDTSASNTTEDVGTSTLHHAHEALVLHDLHAAVDGALVLGAATRGHHHPPPDCVNGVGHQASGNGHSPAKDEGGSHRGVLSSDQERLQGIKESEVHSTVDEDTDGRDGESSVQTLDAIRLQSLDVDIDQSVKLALATLTLGVVGQPGPGKVKGVHKQEGHGSSSATGGNVGGKLGGVGSVLGGGKQGLDGILEGKVKSLGGEVTQHVGQVSPPEGNNAFSGQHPLGAVKDSGIRLVQTTLLDHLVLVLDEKLDPLDGGSHGLGDTGGHTGQHEVLKEPKLLGVTHLVYLTC